MSKASKTPRKWSLVKNKEKSGGQGLIYWLGNTANIIKVPIRSEFDIIGLSKEGLTKVNIDNLAERLGVNKKKMAEEILSLSVKTLERKSRADRLDRRTSSHAVEIARVLQHAYEVFEDEEKIKSWMNKDNRAMNNMKPVQLLETLSGISMVNDVLGRIEEGVYS